MKNTMKNTMNTALAEQIPSFYRDYSELMSSPEFLARVEANPRDAFAREGVEMPENFELRVHKNTKDTTHIVMPPPAASGDKPAFLEDEALGVIAGGAQQTAGTAATGSSASSAGCAPSTASTASSASCTSTVASASSGSSRNNAPTSVSLEV